MSPSDHQYTPPKTLPNMPPDIPPDAGAVGVTRLLDTVAGQFPAAQEARGDRDMELTCGLSLEYELVIDETDRRIIEERITLAREIKSRLNTNRGFQKLLNAREFRKAARSAYQYAKFATERYKDAARFSHVSDTDAFDSVKRVAQRLYRCYLSCRDAFPSPSTKGEWVAAAWSEACAATGENPTAWPQVEDVVTSSMTLLNDMKMRVMYAVETLYGFNTSHALHSISSNVRCAQALVDKMTFTYRELNLDVHGTSHFPYRHPIIQRAINLTWFQNMDSDGIVFNKYFRPIPIKAMALVLTVIECCIYEWSDGTRRGSNWNEERYKTTYRSHIKTLSNFRDHSPPHSKDIVLQIQSELFMEARSHAGAPPEPITEEGRFTLEDMDSALQDELPGYYDSVPTFGGSIFDNP